MDDLDLYLLATQIHKEHKLNSEILSLVWSKITKVDKGFSIDERLNIEIPSTKKLRALNIPEEVYDKILDGALVHEDAHAFLFPFMRYLNNIYAIAKKYSDRAGISFDIKVFDSVENIVSDIINEIIITNAKLPGYEDLPTLTYYYIYLQNISEFEKFENERLEIEKNPLQALWFKHRLTLIKPAQQEKEYFSDILFSTLKLIYADFDIKGWIEYPELLVLGPYIEGIFDLTDSLYNTINRMTTAPQKIEDAEKLESTLLGFFNNIERFNHSITYLMLVLALYRFIIETHMQKTLKSIPTDNIKRPNPPSPEELDKIFLNMTDQTFLSGDILEKIARQILKQALLTKKGVWISQSENSGEATIPWYRYPRGKLVKSTLIKDVLEWRVRKTIPLTTETKKFVTNLPSMITILIDESGSTDMLIDVLAPLTSMATTTFDVERAIIMSILLNTMNNGGEDIPVNLVRFSTTIIAEKCTVKTAYDKIKNNTNPMMNETNIITAIGTAVTMHKDDHENYFILLTDMRIPNDVADIITTTLKTRIRKSPLLIIIIGEEFPKELETLKRRNTAIINIINYKDFKKIEDAIRTLLT
jgi:hypothetical protein